MYTDDTLHNVGCFFYWQKSLNIVTITTKENNMALNEQQIEAVQSNERTILVLACAGAGKSTVLVNRIKRLVDEGVKPWEILALTFTNAAAFEMGEKYRRLFDHEIQHMPEFRTFHSFCYSLLIKDKDVREKLGYTKVPVVCDDAKMKEVYKKAKMLTNCDLSEAKMNGQVKLTAQEKFKLKLYNKAVKQQIQQENIITFDMLCYNICDLFKRNAPEVQKYKEKYKHVLIDEFQDTDPKQFQFISSFPETCSIFAVGDALQCIYQFRNCSNEYVKMLSTAPGWQVIRLYKNYRSTTQICEFANKFSKYAKPEYRVEMEGQFSGDRVEVIPGSHVTFSHPVDTYHLSILTERLMLRKDDQSSCAVLCRTNKEAKVICEELDSKGIKYTTSSKSTHITEVLRSCIDNEYMLQWLSTSLTDAEYGDYIRLASQEEKPDIRWFLTTYKHHKLVKDYGKKVVEIRKILNKSIELQDKFDLVTKLLKIKTKSKFDKTWTSNKELIEGLLEQTEGPGESPIYVGTIHSSKGLEYDSVYVVGADDGMFQLNSEEMKNLYYVAITRAKNHLVVFKY